MSAALHANFSLRFFVFFLRGVLLSPSGSFPLKKRCTKLSGRRLSVRTSGFFQPEKEGFDSLTGCHLVLSPNYILPQLLAHRRSVRALQYMAASKGRGRTNQC